MSDFRLPGMQLTTIRRRSFLATIASIAAALTVTRRSYGAGIVDADEHARGSVHPSRENTLRSSGNQVPTTIDLKTLGPEHQVASISSSGDTYRVTTVSGRTASFSEFDLRFKTDASARGPAEGIPVLMPASIDRAFIVFASPREISSFIDRVASL
jgi:cytochrome c